jgi:hypothetical protein
VYRQWLWGAVRGCGRRNQKGTARVSHYEQHIFDDDDDDDPMVITYRASVRAATEGAVRWLGWMVMMSRTTNGPVWAESVLQNAIVSPIRAVAWSTSPDELPPELVACLSETADQVRAVIAQPPGSPLPEWRSER